VDRICDNARPNSEKGRNTEKTGYKGVGFKSVFCISSNVTIVSLPFCFRFHRAFWNQTEGAKYPWPVIPIWTDIKDVEGKLPKGEKFGVHFVLDEIGKKGENIDEKLKQIFNSVEGKLAICLFFFVDVFILVLLLLRHVRCIEIEPLNIVMLKTDREELIQLKRITGDHCNISYKKLWLIKRIEIRVPNHVTTSIQGLSGVECPEKIKEAKKVCITFGVKVSEEEKIESLDICRIFCYLPTSVHVRLPFLVNCDFLLNQDRTMILDNEWNQFLFYSIGRNQFEWLKELGRDEKWRKYVLYLLSPPTILVRGGLKTCYERGYEEGLREVSFIPSFQRNRFLKFSEAIIDETKFFQRFPLLMDLDVCDSKGECRVVAYDIKGKHRLRDENLKPQMKVYNWDSLLDFLPKCLSSIQVNIEQVIEITKFFASSGCDVELLRRKKLILCSSCTFKSAESCYIATEANTKMINAIHLFCIPTVHFKLVGDQYIRGWLQERLAVPILTSLNLVRTHIPKMISESQITDENWVAILRFIYEGITCGDLKELTEEDYASLNRFPVKTKGGEFLPINSVHLQLSHLDTAHVNQTNTISEEYQEEGDNISQWENILTRMGIQTKIALRIIDDGNYIFWS